jgi:hypothetical protein
MALDTKLNLSNQKFEQWTGDTLNLSGTTVIFNKLQYGLDNSASFTPLSVPTAGWVTGLTSNLSSSLIVNNGLTRVNNNIRLGGNLTGDTFIRTTGGTHFVTLLGAVGRMGVGASAPGARLEIQGASSDNTTSSLIIRKQDTSLLMQMRNDGFTAFGGAIDSNFNYTFNTSTVGFKSTQGAQIHVVDTDADTNRKVWVTIQDTSGYKIRTLNDLYNTILTPVDISRDGKSIQTVAYTATTAGESAHLFTGNLSNSTSIASNLFGISATHTLIARQHQQNMYGVNISPTINIGSFTGVTSYGLMVLGATSNSSGYALRVGNNTPQNILQVRNDGISIFGNSTLAPRIYTSSTGIASDINGTNFIFAGTTSFSNGAPRFNFYNTTSDTSTSGDRIVMGSLAQAIEFSPSSGNASFTYLAMRHRINTTGTHTGITYGIDYNPNVLSSTGTHIAWRNVTGQVVIGSTSIPNNVQLGVNSNGFTKTLSLYSSGTEIWTLVGAGITHTANQSTFAGTGYNLSSSSSSNSANSATGFRIVGSATMGASFSGTFTNIGISPTYNTNAAGSGTIYGFDYNPTVTQIGTNTHIAARFSSGSVVIGSTTFTGNTRVEIFGNSSGNILRLNSNAGAQRAVFLDNGNITFGDGVVSTSMIYVPSTGIQMSGRGISLNGQAPVSQKIFGVSEISTSSSDQTLVFGYPTQTATSGTRRVLSLNTNFAVSTGTATFTALSLLPQINTTGTYSGQIIGFDYSPTLTSIASGATHIAFRSTAGRIVATGNTRTSVKFSGTWTEVATNDTHVEISPNITGLGTSAGDQHNFSALSIIPTLTHGSGSASQNAIGIYNSPNFASTPGSGRQYIWQTNIANINDSVQFRLTNTNSGTSATSRINFSNNTGQVVNVQVNSSTNTTFAGGGSFNIVTLNGGSPIGFGVASTIYYTISNANTHTFTSASKTFNNTMFTINQTANTAGTSGILSVIGGAHTGVNASTESTDVNFNLARTVSWATGSFATQRAFRIQAPTYAFAGTSTINNAATLSISNAPVAGTNASILNRHAIWVEAGDSYSAGKWRSDYQQGFSLNAGTGLTQVWNTSFSSTAMSGIRYESLNYSTPHVFAVNGAMAQANASYSGVTLQYSFTPITGNGNFRALSVRPTINSIATHTGTIYGIDYNPVVTSVASGATHYAARFTSGSVVIGNTSITGLTRLDVRNANSTSNVIRLANNLNSTMFSINDNGILTHTSTVINGFGAIFQSTSSGDVDILNVISNFTKTSGTHHWVGQRINPTFNITGTHSGTIIGLDYNPTVTSMGTGSTHIAIRATSGKVIIGATGLQNTNNLVEVNGVTSVYNGSSRSVQLNTNGRIFLGSSTASAGLGAITNQTSTFALAGNSMGYHADQNHSFIVNNKPSLSANASNYFFGGGFTSSVGSGTGTFFNLTPVHSTTGGTPTVVGIDYNPSGSLGSATHYAARFRSGNVLFGVATGGTNSRVLSRGSDGSSLNNAGRFENSTGQLIGQFRNDQTFELGGSSAVLEVNSSILSGNAVLRFLAYTGGTGLGYRFQDTLLNDYLNFRSLTTDKAVVFRQPTEYDYNQGYKKINRQYTVTTDTTNNGQHVVFEFTVANDEHYDIKVLHADATATDRTSITSMGIDSADVRKVSGSTITGNTVISTQSRLPHSTTTGTFNWHFDTASNKIQYRFQNTSTGKVFTVWVDMSYVKRSTPIEE